jgi:hypothetical protein
MIKSREGQRESKREREADQRPHASSHSRDPTLPSSSKDSMHSDEQRECDGVSTDRESHRIDKNLERFLATNRRQMVETHDSLGHSCIPAEGTHDCEDLEHLLKSVR